MTNGTTAKELLANLSSKYGHRFRNYFSDEEGRLVGYYRIGLFINSRSITTLQGFDTKLKEGDVISIFLPIGGG